MYILSKRESERINVVKVLMCVGVLFLHSYSSAFENAGGIARFITNGTDYISNTVFDCAVPVYILISSILLYSKEFEWKENIQKKIYSIVIPYLIFNSLWILVSVVKIYVLHHPDSSSPDYLSFRAIDWIDSYLGIRGEYKPALNVLWYLRDLFLLNALAVPIKKISDRFPKAVFFIIFLIWASCVKSFVIHTYALTFFCMGYYIVKFDIHLKQIDKTSPYVFSVAFFLLTIVDYMLKDYGFIHRVAIIVGIIFVFSISNYISSGNKLFEIIAPSVFFIYLTHRFVYSIMNIFVSNTTVGIYVVMYFVKPFVALLAGITVFYFLHKYYPWLLGFLTGGRSKRKI